jgi:hypothetical protein
LDYKTVFPGIQYEQVERQALGVGHTVPIVPISNRKQKTFSNAVGSCVDEDFFGFRNFVKVSGIIISLQ